jgi:alcohol dehydrogenase
MVADILPTRYEVGVLNGGVRPRHVVVVVSAGPVGLADIMGSWMYSPSHEVAERPSRQPARISEAVRR